MTGFLSERTRWAIVMAFAIAMAGVDPRGLEGF